MSAIVKGYRLKAGPYYIVRGRGRTEVKMVDSREKSVELSVYAGDDAAELRFDLEDAIDGDHARRAIIKKLGAERAGNIRVLL